MNNAISYDDGPINNAVSISPIYLHTWTFIRQTNPQTHTSVLIANFICILSGAASNTTTSSCMKVSPRMYDPSCPAPIPERHRPPRSVSGRTVVFAGCSISGVYFFLT